MDLYWAWSTHTVFRSAFLIPLTALKIMQGMDMSTAVADNALGN
jgi:hypothetical protein